MAGGDAGLMELVLFLIFSLLLIVSLIYFRAKKQGMTFSETFKDSVQGQKSSAIILLSIFAAVFLFHLISS